MFLLRSPLFLINCWSFSRYHFSCWILFTWNDQHPLTSSLSVICLIITIPMVLLESCEQLSEDMFSVVTSNMKAVFNTTVQCNTLIKVQDCQNKFCKERKNPHVHDTKICFKQIWDICSLTCQPISKKWRKMFSNTNKKKQRHKNNSLLKKKQKT